MVTRTIHKLRQRPHHERRAIAAMIAIGVVVIMLVGWMFYFLHSLGGSNIQTTPELAQDQGAPISGDQQPSSRPTAVATSTDTAPSINWDSTSSSTDQSAATDSP